MSALKLISHQALWFLFYVCNGEVFEDVGLLLYDKNKKKKRASRPSFHDSARDSKIHPHNKKKKEGRKETRKEEKVKSKEKRKKRKESTDEEKE